MVQIVDTVYQTFFVTDFFREFSQLQKNMIAKYLNSYIIVLVNFSTAYQSQKSFNEAP